MTIPVPTTLSSLGVNELLAKARLDIRDGEIHYRLYRQDGSMQPMSCRDTPSNRLFVSWAQAHDRYTVGRKEGA
jgi:hypothetical protein